MPENKTSESGKWITYFLYIALFLIFLPWELIQLARDKPTMSQYVIAKSGKGNKWKVLIVLFVLVTWSVTTWLWWHWCIGTAIKSLFFGAPYAC